MTASSPLLDFFKRGEVARDVRLLAAEGGFAPRGSEQLAILVVLSGDADAEVREAAARTLSEIPGEALRAALARRDMSSEVREFFAARGVVPSASAAPKDSGDDPLVDRAAAGDEVESVDGSSEASAEGERGTIVQRLAKMTFADRLKAALKGSREMRSILVRDPNKMIAASVLASPKLNEAEVESFAKMANVSEDVLRAIARNRGWTKNYAIVLGLTKNPKTPLALSMNFMARLNDRDLTQLSVDRNVPEPLRIAARKRVLAGTSRGA